MVYIHGVSTHVTLQCELWGRKRKSDANVNRSFALRRANSCLAFASPR
jgi:hypothetical protein